MSLTKHVNKFRGGIISRIKHNDLLYTLLQIGVLSIAISAPAIAPVAIFVNSIHNKDGNKDERKIKKSFYHFLKKGYIKVDSHHGKTCVMLTREGERRARFSGACRVLNENLVSKVIKWDGNWRIILFDLKNEKSKERNAIRLMLRRCGFAFLQKSVWIYPYQCTSEVNFLRSFFQLSDEEFRLIVSDNIGNDDNLRRLFNLTSKG